VWPSCCVCSKYVYTQGLGNTDLFLIKKVRKVVDLVQSGYTWVIFDRDQLEVVPGNESAVGYFKMKISAWTSPEQRRTGVSTVLYTKKPSKDDGPRTDEQVSAFNLGLVSVV
jgi:hypothetical protein